MKLFCALHQIKIKDIFKEHTPPVFQYIESKKSLEDECTRSICAGCQYLFDADD